METAKKNGSIISVVILTILVVVLGGYIVYDKTLSNDTVTSTKSTEKESTSEQNVNESISTNNQKESLEGQFYILEGLRQKRRYYLAFDNAETLGEDNRFIDYRQKKVYLVDMNLSNTNDFIKEIDFPSLINDVYNEKINNLPSVLNQGTVNEINKSQCTEYRIQYTTSDDYMFDGAKEIPFGIYYACFYNDGQNISELSLGTEYYKLDVTNMKVTK